MKSCVKNRIDSFCKKFQKLKKKNKRFFIKVKAGKPETTKKKVAQKMKKTIKRGEFRSENKSFIRLVKFIFVANHFIENTKRTD
jgi:hypothetical protein